MSFQEPREATAEYTQYLRYGASVELFVKYEYLPPQRSKVDAFASPKSIATAYATYKFYDDFKSFSSSYSQCRVRGEVLANFSSNAEFQALLTAINGESDLTNEEFWVDVDTVSCSFNFYLETRHIE
ncbi:hypothetical protein PoB_001195600 [Plakobranchus ocellatus]|uniref:Uncharacterized protein n=1 Tax=Plakobranchus ocellatus TaxID=259542 RepID=A0AAV3YSS3_9GAST|nr:hypothetical protein PoB_001195600 [Plakobranchus ocellatus]